MAKCIKYLGTDIITDKEYFISQITDNLRDQRELTLRVATPHNKSINNVLTAHNYYLMGEYYFNNIVAKNMSEYYCERIVA
jgi:hypothetical protein